MPVRAASIMGPRGWEVMRRSTDNYFITRGGVYKCARSKNHDESGRAMRFAHRGAC